MVNRRGREHPLFGGWAGIRPGAAGARNGDGGQGLLHLRAEGSTSAQYAYSRKISSFAFSSARQNAFTPCPAISAAPAVRSAAEGSRWNASS
jgi:hypothetical protein